VRSFLQKHLFKRLSVLTLERWLSPSNIEGRSGMSAQQGFRHVVRLANTDLNGSLPLVYGLAGIKGVGFNTALAFLRVAGIDPWKLTGELTDEEIKKIEAVIADPLSSGVPGWLLNRRKDYETGLDLHLVGSDLIFKARQDIEREMKIKSWRGIRHSLGLKVRGQRTSTTGRFGPTVGVTKKKPSGK